VRWVSLGVVVQTNGSGGAGISLAFEVAELERAMERAKASTHGFIIQKYLEAPLLYHGRKFDLRVWAICASDAGSQIGMRVYAFREGYARTSSEQVALPTADGRHARGAPAGDGETCRTVQEAVRHEQMVHLTNYCMQGLYFPPSTRSWRIRCSQVAGSCSLACASTAAAGGCVRSSASISCLRRVGGPS